MSVVADAGCLVELHGGCNGTLRAAYRSYNSSEEGFDEAGWNCTGPFKGEAALNALLLSRGIPIDDPTEECFGVELVRKDSGGGGGGGGVARTRERWPS